MSNTTSQTLPPTCRALICPGPGQPLKVQTIPTPTAHPGSVIVHILAAAIDSILPTELEGSSPWIAFPTPFTPGGKAIGRIAATGPDTTSLQPNQLVMLEPYVRGRDNPDVQFLWGVSHLGTPASKNLMEASWRDGMFAEYVRAPLENCFALNEKILMGDPADGGFGYSAAELTYIPKQLVAYGGLRGIDVKAGETVIVAPATGGHSAAAVEVASAMGARVVAVGRNMDALKKIAAKNQRVAVVQLTGSVEEDTAALEKFGPIDAYIDLSPEAAAKSTHLRSCLMALKPYGRASLMGALNTDIPIPIMVASFKNLTIRGQFMYEREDTLGLIKLIEAGVLGLGKNAGQNVVGQFPLEDWEKAFDTAKGNPEAGKIVVFTP